MPLSLNTTNSFSSKVGAHGVSPEQMHQLEPRLRAALVEMWDRYDAGEWEFLDLPFDAGAYLTSQQAAECFRGAENLVVAGIGGSALGPAAIFGALAHPLHNL